MKFEKGLGFDIPVELLSPSGIEVEDVDQDEVGVGGDAACDKKIDTVSFRDLDLR